MYYIGIDGGGTKTSFTIVNKEGNKIDRLITSTIHYEQIGFDRVESLLRESLKTLLRNNSIEMSQIKGVFLGLPGYGEVKSVKDKIDNIVKNVLKGTKYKIGNDVEVGLVGSLAGKSGINIVSGTGSIALGKDNRGKSIRCGGWGSYIGDEGSAYWIGKRTLEAFSKQSDSRNVKDELYYIIKKHLEIEDDYDIIDYSINKIKKDRTKIAKLSKLCYEAAIKGDSNAIKIFEDAAYELSLLVEAIIKKLRFDEEIMVSYSGGVFSSGDLVLNPLKKNLSNYKIEFIEPILGPGEGACIMAYELDDIVINDNIINNLNKEIEEISLVY